MAPLTAQKMRTKNQTDYSCGADYPFAPTIRTRTENASPSGGHFRAAFGGAGRTKIKAGGFSVREAQP